ncbi:MAG: Nucleoside-diphosphate-sugar epimerase [Candidatus Methanohalarchaeum thermophilum]|uniref:Nucleoside-diphosphate-sugar epimerase n=1 Tax=Methanohalarchaeum thermophilum TaxID=1903181 RepID=A0A1Q6DUB6_METT1|nr:MAG: Nucleoside-diphosphate-sugar epimerase [Candidatus Methanohalarchaeum thermophilum]
MEYEKIAITGSNGFIGRNLTKNLLNQDKTIIGIDNFSNSKKKDQIEHPRYSHYDIDIRNLEELKKAINGIDAVFHLAAQSTVPKSTKYIDKDFEINTKGTLNVLKISKETDAKVINVSTSTVYGIPNSLPTSEESPIKPISFYGASKASAESYCFAFNGTYDTSVVSLRLYNVYGPGNRKGVMWDFFNKLNANPSHLEILGTGKQEKDYIYITDVVEALNVALDRGEPGEAYNVGSSCSYTVNELAERIFEIMDIDPEVTYTGGKSWKGDVEKTKADISKLKKLGWKPEIGLDEGLKNYYKWFKRKI